MKKKIMIPLTIILSLSIVTYIYQRNTNTINNSITTHNKVNKNDTKQTYGVKVNNNAYDITKFIDGDKKVIYFFHYFDKNRVCIVTKSSKDKNTIIRIYNSSNKKIEKQINFSSINKQYGPQKFSALNNGFYVVDKNTKNLLYYIYNKNLKLIKKIDLSKLDFEGKNSVVLSNNAQKLAYIHSYTDIHNHSHSEIYTCDLNLSNKQKICKVDSFKLNKFSAFYVISFSKDDKKIDFVGDIYKGENNQPTAFGVVNIQDDKFKYKVHNKLRQDIQLAQNKSFFIDIKDPYKKDSSGQVFSIDNSTNDISQYDLKDKNESVSAYISDKGNFIVTRLDGKLQNKEPIYRFRIYDVKSKHMSKQFDITFAGKDYSKCVADVLAISEKNKKFYVRYFLDGEQKVYEYKIRNE